MVKRASNMRTAKVLRTAGLIAALLLAFPVVSFADVTDKFVPGTTINDVNIAGLTVGGAKEKIENYYTNEYVLTIIEKDGVREFIKGAEIGCAVEVPEGLQAILDAQNANGRSAGPAFDNSHTMQIQVSYDENALLEKINGLSCVSGENIVKTQDAHISEYQEGQPFSIIPEVRGNNVDVDKVTVLVKEAIAGSKTQISLQDGGCYYTVGVMSDDEQLKALCDTLNKYKDMKITYQFGENTEELAGDLICSWLGTTSDGEISVNRDMAAAYVKGLAEKYDTAGTTRNFKTAAGNEVTLTGPYGWKINQAAEADALVAMIKTGQSQEREPEYLQKAASRQDGDWGNTYVETDLTGQHVYMYQDGNQVWDAPCVTGNVSKGHTTPEGIYSLTYKETDRILRGEKKADGTYEYESHVDYWMPFNGGIGFHDATWRSKFGGTIFQYGGSHGCVNLPPEKAKILYDLIASGMPVICYN